MSSDIFSRLAKLEQEWEAYKILAGVSLSQWLSPAKASPILGLGKEKILRLIEEAELARAQNRRHQLVYGKHYRILPGDRGDRQVDWQAINELMSRVKPEEWAA